MIRTRALSLVAIVAGCAAAPEPAPARPRPIPPPAAPPAQPIASAEATVDPAPPPPDEVIAPAKATLTSQGYFTWVWPKPKADGRYIGMIRIGTSVAVKSTDLVKGEKCSGGFYAIEPHGYVCADRTVTRDPPERSAALWRSIAAKPGPLPYHYALSDGAPMYSRIPTEREQKRKEGGFNKPGHWRHLVKALSAYEELAAAETIAPDGELPGPFGDRKPAFEERQDLVKDTIPLGSTLAYTRSFDAGGRTFLLSTDFTIVPADRLRPFKPSEFHGTKLGEGVSLPIAWMKKTEKPKYARKDDGSFEKTGATWAVRSFVELASGRVEVDKTAYLETKEHDAAGKPLYVEESDATVVEARDSLPFGIGDDERWLLVKISQGTLVAYDGKKPVFATLVSPGKGGVPMKGQDPVKNATTPLGSYHITYKDRATTMSPDKIGDPHTFFIADVPNTQYFDPPFALHAAFWHDRFGEPTSAGCINVSPLDAELLFGFTEPAVPEGWQGATGAGAPENGRASWVVVAR